MRTTPNRIGFGDEDVLWRVQSYLCSKQFPVFRDLQVQVHRGEVTITGKVDSFHERQVALNCCRRVAGVLKLIDQIEVSSPPSHHLALRRSTAIRPR
jgi:osmotically-inducible protein OsmY